MEKKDYINNQEFYDLLKNAIPYFKQNKNWGIFDKKIGKFILLMMERIKNRSNFKNYKGYHWEYMQEKALINVFTYITKYDLKRTNPFAYFTTVITNAYRTALREIKEKKVIELPHENSVLCELIDESEYEVFDDNISDKIDRERHSERLIQKVTDEQLVDEISSILHEINQKHGKNNNKVEK